MNKLIKYINELIKYIWLKDLRASGSTEIPGLESSRPGGAHAGQRPFKLTHRRTSDIGGRAVRCSFVWVIASSMEQEGSEGRRGFYPFSFDSKILSKWWESKHWKPLTSN